MVAVLPTKTHTQLLIIWPVRPFVLVCCDCCNKLPHTWWLKMTGRYSLKVLEARRLKQRCWDGCAPSRGSERDSVPWLFWWLVREGAAGHSVARGHFPPISASILKGLLLWVSYKDTCDWIQVHSDNLKWSFHLEIFNYIDKGTLSKQGHTNRLWGLGCRNLDGGVGGRGLAMDIPTSPPWCPAFCPVWSARPHQMRQLFTQGGTSVRSLPSESNAVLLLVQHVLSHSLSAKAFRLWPRRAFPPVEVSAFPLNLQCTWCTAIPELSSRCLLRIVHNCPLCSGSATSQRQKVPLHLFQYLEHDSFFWCFVF